MPEQNNKPKHPKDMDPAELKEWIQRVGNSIDESMRLIEDIKRELKK